jgi:multiple sugar transport system ATP-binding protein
VQMRLELARLHKELQATMIYVTHDQVEAMTLADKVVVLNSGRIEQVGSPLDLYHQPANLFVAGFLGTPKMGFLKGKVTRVEGQGCEVQLDAGTLISLPLSGATLSVGSAVTLGIRPEHLELAAPGQTRLTVTADVGERLGSDTFCHVITANGEPLTLRIRGDMASQYGETLHLHLDPAHCHLFDTDGVAVTRPLRAAA